MELVIILPSLLATWTDNLENDLTPPLQWRVARRFDE
jgi:hypothetical protein